jgi:hypothetical protein
MIYIEKGEKVPLPKEFHRRHNISVILYDLIADILVKARYRTLKVTKIPLDKETRKIISQLNKGGIHILDYLETNQRKNEIVTVLSKHIFTCVLEDFLNFMYESLSCAKKGKMSVAYTLLRKPLTDELLILEQLFINREDFVDRFWFQGSPNLYDPSAGNLGHEKIKSIISSVTDQIGVIGPFFRDLIFDLRYNKSSVSNLNGLMNHGHHIVTADKNYKTEYKNLNFVFSIDEDYVEYWNHYYHFVPYLLLYSSSVVDRLAHQFVKVNAEYRTLREFKRYLAMLFWNQETSTVPNKGIKQLFRLFTKDLRGNCECGKRNRIVGADHKLFFESDAYLCVNCFGNLLRTSDLSKQIEDLFTRAEA